MLAATAFSLHARGNQPISTLALMVGFALMLALDNAFG
jgi:hypothetical protein